MRKEEEIFKFRIRGFYAYEHPSDCLKFIQGHQRVLIDHGFYHISSNNAEWVGDKNSYVLLAESLDGSEVYGGVRILGRTHQNLLELEKALLEKEPRLKEFVEEKITHGLGEVCGLWNAKKVAGYRISFLLVRTAIAIMPSLNYHNAIAFLAKYTLYIAENLGFKLVKNLGENGVFYYPNEYFVAGIYLNNRLNSLQHLSAISKSAVLNLRKDFNCIRLEKTPWERSFLVTYELQT